MGKWVCTGCNYGFNSEKPSQCPYCGKAEKLQKEPSANDILEEVEEILNE